MALKVLTASQIEQFMELGWVRVEEAYPRKDALAAAEFLWRKLEEQGVYAKDPATWTKPFVRLNETYDTPEFKKCNTERLWGAIEDLVGLNRVIHRENIGWGYWVLNFSEGADKPWNVPYTGWHHDGGHFRHFIDSPEQGLLQLCFFSEVHAGGGAPIVIEGSQNVVARLLKDHPEGLELREAIRREFEHPYLAEIIRMPAEPDSEQTAAERIEKFMNTSYKANGFEMRVAEPIGGPGDVILGHPFLIHASSQNRLQKPRFLCTRTVPLKERLNLRRTNEADYSMLELATIRAMG